MTAQTQIYDKTKNFLRQFDYQEEHQKITISTYELSINSVNKPQKNEDIVFFELVVSPSDSLKSTKKFCISTSFMRPRFASGK